MSETKRSGQFVVPGEKLGVIEEFIPDAGTYVENGFIHSKSLGHILMDVANKKVSVYPVAHNVNVPKVGNTIVGNTISVQSSLATVRILKTGDDFVSSLFSGMIHVSDVSFQYTKNMLDAFRIGDLVRAKVISDKNLTLHLSTKGGNLGVIHAFCSRCGHFLSLAGNVLKCETCGNVERRKTASDYGTGTP